MPMIGTGMPGASLTYDFAETFVSPSASTWVWSITVASMNAVVVMSGKTLTTIAPPTAAPPARGRAREREVLEPDRVLRDDADVAVRDQVRALADRRLGVEEDDLDADRRRDAGAAVLVRGARAAGEAPDDQVVLLVAGVDGLDRDAVAGDDRVLADRRVVRDVREVDADGGRDVRALAAHGETGRLGALLAQVLGADLHLAARAGDVRVVADLRPVRRHDPVQADRRRDADAAAVRVAALRAGLAVAGVGAAVRAVAVLRGRQRAGALAVLVFGLLSTWSCFFLSASSSPLSAPFAVASACASLFVEVSAITLDRRALDVCARSRPACRR